jgi:trimethylamine:corrinoid methyltransferase-like protein
VTHAKQDYYGALVGWTSQSLGSRLVLHVEGVTTPPPHDEEAVDSFYFVMEKNQAVLLGNYLFRMAGATQPAPPRRKLLHRLFGRS